MLLRRLQYWSGFTVVRWQLILTVILLLISWRYFNANYEKEKDPQQWFVIDKYFLLIFWTTISLFGFSILSAVSAWLFFLYRKSQKKIGLQTQFGKDINSDKAVAGKVPVTITLSSVFRPLLGTVRARLIFAGMKVSDVVLLDQNIYEKRSIVRKAIRGTGETELHDRGIYDVEEVQILFSDMFRLIALPYTLHVSQQLYTLPQELKAKQVKAEPNATEEQTQRIEIPKKVEGEFINYKDFETGDDVRRIVWKIYARSGQLVVRIPETKDPYASHLYFYASFYDGMNNSPDGIFETELLNTYKDKVRNLFEALEKNNYEVRLPLDQETQKLAGMSDKRNELFQITAAHWQKNMEPVKYVNSGKAAFVTLSSMVPAGDVAQLLGNIPFNVPVVVVRLSDAIVSPFRIRFKSLFFIPEKKANDKLRQPWLISPLRSRLLENERTILRMLQQRGNSWMISAAEHT
ncbi:MAG: DUF58 domain-containing protein [Bacteroidota bacterium]|nr:DUF58 domain-containing protein [Bacteroidota bacterium]